MYLITGGAGFIGSAFLAHLNSKGITNVLVVDNLGKNEKWKNLRGKDFTDLLSIETFSQQLISGNLPKNITAVIHLGACSSTTETDADYVIENNFRYSCRIAEWTKREKIRFIYASSAATYGDGSQGFMEDSKQLSQLRPLNVYGFSKHLFDLWALKSGVLDSAAGIKFFNVFGPNEYHKENMTSVVYKAFHQIQATGKVQLFRSYRADFQDGEQKRDFIYVKDCSKVLFWLLQNPSAHGLLNLGTGQARTWKDLVVSIFTALGKATNIEFIDMPEPMREKYQYFTQAEMKSLHAQGYTAPFTPLEESVRDYVLAHLATQDPYL